MTADSAQDEDAAANRRLGAHIRRLRHARSMTLVTLAEATDLSHPFLSQLERGLAQPSLSSLRKIAVALETSPIELIAAGDAVLDAPTSEVHRAGTGAVAEGFAAGSARMLVHAGRPLHPVEVEGGNADPGEVFVHAEDEFLYVLGGAVLLELDGEETRLAPGDSAYYSGGVAHRWWSADGAPYRLLVVKQAPAGRP